MAKGQPEDEEDGNLCREGVTWVGGSEVAKKHRIEEQGFDKEACQEMVGSSPILPSNSPIAREGQQG